MRAYVWTVNALHILNPPPHIAPSPQPDSICQQTESCSLFCQGCDHIPHGGLPWHWDTLERNSVVVPTESVPTTVCTFHTELHLRHRELTKSILKRGKTKPKHHILLSLSFIWFMFRPKVVLCQTIPLLQFYYHYVNAENIRGWGNVAPGDTYIECRYSFFNVHLWFKVVVVSKEVLQYLHPHFPVWHRKFIVFMGFRQSFDKVQEEAMQL